MGPRVQLLGYPAEGSLSRVRVWGSSRMCWECCGGLRNSSALFPVKHGRAKIVCLPGLGQFGFPAGLRLQGNEERHSREYHEVCEGEPGGL